ncbi:MAG: M20/M25/M40 family metallo-hydrolase [Deltaproteobacteria bacterium]|nr:M20/M25/M40 family metallo-hydrolase [Deltaproteobacteria bacterium]
MVYDTVRAAFARGRERHAREILDLLGPLVAARTANAGREGMAVCPGQEVPGEETRVVEIVRPVLASLGADCRVHALDPRRANLVATLGDQGPVLAVGCHADVVPPGDGWEADPWTVTERDGFLVGRGVLDDKGPLAASVVAMRVLVESGVRLAGRFQLAVIASEEHREEGEPDPGIGYLLETGALKPDYAIIPDVGENMRRIDVAEKGRAVFRITAVGRQAHGSTPERGVNAVTAMARFISRMEASTLPHEVHPVLGSPTVNLGIIQGGAAANIVPGECTTTWDVRYVPGQTPEGVLATFRAVASDLGGEWRFHVADASLPHAIPADHPLVFAVQRSTEAVLGFQPEPFGMGGGTFAKAFNLGGIPAIGFGPGDEDQYHVANERVEWRQLVDFAEVLACVAVDLLGVR